MSVFDVISETFFFQQSPNAFFVATPAKIGPSVLRDHFVPKIIFQKWLELSSGCSRNFWQKIVEPFQKSVVSLSVDKTSTPDKNIFHKSQISYLMIDPLVVKDYRRFDLVRLYASHVERLFACQVIDQSRHRQTEQSPCCLRSFRCL